MPTLKAAIQQIYEAFFEQIILPRMPEFMFHLRSNSPFGAHL